MNVLSLAHQYAKELNFDAIEWDGEELTAYSFHCCRSTLHPFPISAFAEGSKTKDRLECLEENCITWGTPPFKVWVSQEVYDKENDVYRG